MSRKRAAIAGAFALLYPGLGHVYLREWARAALWFGGAIAVAALVIPSSFVDAFDASGIAGLYEASRNLPLDAVLSLAAIRLLNVVDAVRLGLHPRPADGGDDGPSGPTCPDCGGELDEDLDFCPWCSNVLSGQSGS